MAYRRRATRRNPAARKRVRRKSASPYSKGYAGKSRVYAPKRKRVRRSNASRSAGRVLQTLRIELAPGLTLGKSPGGIQRPVRARRTRHF